MNLTPQQKAANVEKYKRVYAVVYEVEKCLNLGKTGDATCRAVQDLFEAIPHPLRGTLAKEGAFHAMNRLQKAEGPIADCIDRLYRNANADDGYKRRLFEFWECLGDSQDSGVEDGEDADHVPGEVDDENEVPVRQGGLRAAPPDRDGGHVAEAPAKEQAGGPRGAFVFPGSESAAAQEEAEPVASIDDENPQQHDEDGEDDDGSGV